MNKKNIGIATILVLILLIVIGIARANAQVNRVQLDERYGFALTDLGNQQARVHLPDLYVTPVLGKLETANDLDLSAASLNKVLSLSPLLNSQHEKLALSVVHGDALRALDLDT